MNARPLRVVSLFAGIGGFDLGFSQAGMTIVAHVEKDPHCRKLLAAKWPDSVVLDDVRTAGKHNLPPCDVICGGFPCQDLSVAGKRAGLQGERSGLFYEMARIVSEMRPTFVIFENVPGLLSSCGGNDWDLVVDEFTNLGYVLDANVLDAQFFGVAQRRKRIFGVCTRADHLLKQRTLSSLQTLLQWVQEVLLTILVGARHQYVTALPELAASAGLCADGLMQKMQLFGITTKKEWIGFAENLAETFQSCLKDSRNSESVLNDTQNGRSKADTKDSAPSQKESEQNGGNIATLWSDLWDEKFRSQNSSIISTALKQTTESKISICAEISSITCWLIVQSKNFYQTFLEGAASALTVNKVFTNYARQSVSDLFTDPQGLRDHRDYLVRHEGRFRVLPCGHSGTKRAEEVLLVHEGVRGHPAPRRETRQDVAGTPGGSSQSGGFRTTDLDNNGAFICADKAGCLSPGAHPGGFNGQDAYTGHLVGMRFFDQQRDAVYAEKGIASTCSARDYKEATDLIVHEPTAVAFKPSHFTRGKDGAPSDVYPPLSADADKGDQEAVVFQKAGDSAPVVASFSHQSGGDCRGLELRETSACLQVEQTQAAIIGSAVRRLTPRECERLQGFPDEWTAGFADSTRYRMLGNAVAVCAARWIARRICAQHQREEPL